MHLKSNLLVPETREWQRAGFSISTDPEKVDLGAVHAYLSESYWAHGIPLAVLQRAISASLCFGLYRGHEQVGFARVVTDHATFAYLCDVYVLPEYQGRGLGKWLIACVMEHPSLQGLRRIMLRTRDAHGLYAPFGFAAGSEPEKLMEIVNRSVYERT